MTTSAKTTKTIVNFYTKLVAFMLETRQAKPAFQGRMHQWRPCPACEYNAALIFSSPNGDYHAACPRCKKVTTRPAKSKTAFENSDCGACGSPSIERCKGCDSVDAPTPAELDQAAREQDAADKAAKRSAKCDSCGKRRKLNDQIILGKALCKQCVSDANTIDM